MRKNNKHRDFDLEERTFRLALNTRGFLKKVKNTIANYEDGKQLIRSSASIAANYIEANEALSKKDFIYRIKVCRKEAKESILFFRLIETSENSLLQEEKNKLIMETTELMKIFGAIITRTDLQK